MSSRHCGRRATLVLIAIWVGVAWADEPAPLHSLGIPLELVLTAPEDLIDAGALVEVTAQVTAPS
jgi:hypothetical protein